MKLSMLGVAAFSATVFVGAADAATVGFNNGPPGGVNYTEAGFQFDDVRIVNGNCDMDAGTSTDRPCAALNPNEMFTMTLAAGGTFDLNGFWFQLLGNGGRPGTEVNTVIVMTDLGGNAVYSENDFPNNNGGQFVDTSTLSLFQGVSSVKFSRTGGGNARIDDISGSPTTVSAVPLPAAAWMLLAGLGGLTLMRRKQA